MNNRTERCVDARFWAGKRILLTGHTGFKGSWASLWLTQMGAHVVGFALPPPKSFSLFALAGVERDIENIFGDVRDRDSLQQAVNRSDPQIVLHFAAQPFVRQSFREPVETFWTNVMGTVHLLEALRSCPNVEAILIVTTDKVYMNADKGHAFKEQDPLGGNDPYAASKAASEHVVTSYASAFFDPLGIPIATGRGGNVIGGGDFSDDRVVPDIWRALSRDEPVKIRYPNATRPWQHVLDCLAGYFLYVETLAVNPRIPRALNFGPSPDSQISVATLVETMQNYLGVGRGWVQDVSTQVPEKRLLAIDPSLAHQVLGWRQRLAGHAAIQGTASWYSAFVAGADMRQITLNAIEDFISK